MVHTVVHTHQEFKLPMLQMDRVQAYAADGQAYAVPYQYPCAGLYGQQPANQVIIREQYQNNDSDLALGMLAGAATGMALGSLFWVF